MLDTRMSRGSFLRTAGVVGGAVAAAGIGFGGAAKAQTASNETTVYPSEDLPGTPPGFANWFNIQYALYHFEKVNFSPGTYFMGTFSILLVPMFPDKKTVMPPWIEPEGGFPAVRELVGIPDKKTGALPKILVREKGNLKTGYFPTACLIYNPAGIGGQSISFRNLEIEHQGWDAIHLFGANGIEFDNCILRATESCFICLFSGNDVQGDFKITNSRITHTGHGNQYSDYPAWKSSYGGIFLHANVDSTDPSYIGLTNFVVSNNIVESLSKTAYYGIFNNCSAKYPQVENGQAIPTNQTISNNQVKGPSIGILDIAGNGVTQISGNYHECGFQGPFGFDYWENTTTSVGLALVAYPGAMKAGSRIEGNTFVFKANPNVYIPGKGEGPFTANLTMGMYLGQAPQPDVPFEIGSVLENTMVKNNTIRSEIPIDYGIQVANKSNNNTFQGNIVQASLKPSTVYGEPAFFDVRRSVYDDPNFSGAPFGNAFVGNRVVGSGRFGFLCDGSQNTFQDNLTSINPLPMPPSGALYKFTSKACGNSVVGYIGGSKISVIDTDHCNDIAGLK